MKRTTSRRILAAALIFALSSCASTAPVVRVPSFDTADEYVYGGWADVRRDHATPGKLRGELIAVSADRLYLLTSTGVVEVPKSDVTSVTVKTYDPKSLVTRLAPGILLAVTNGYFLLLSIPAWAIAGTMLLHDESVSGEVSYPADSWEALGKTARFPQGLPPAVDLTKLAIR